MPTGNNPYVSRDAIGGPRGNFSTNPVLYGSVPQPSISSAAGDFFSNPGNIAGLGAGLAGLFGGLNNVFGSQEMGGMSVEQIENYIDSLRRQGIGDLRAKGDQARQYGVRQLAASGLGITPGNAQAASNPIFEMESKSREQLMADLAALEQNMLLQRSQQEQAMLRAQREQQGDFFGGLLGTGVNLLTLGLL